MHMCLTGRRLAGALVVLSAALGLSTGSLAQGAASSSTAVAGSDVVALACSFEAPQPKKDGAYIRATASISGCGGSAKWKLTLQRHRGGPWWQNEGTATRTGDGSLTVSAGCVSGTRTYRTILEQTNGSRKSVSPQLRTTC